MSHLLPRFTDTRLADERKVAQIILETSPPATMTNTVARATLAGDSRRLRGIPAVARGVSGVSPGTDPVNECLRADRSMRYSL